MKRIRENTDPTGNRAVKRADKALAKAKALTEAQEQVLVIEWANLQACKYPMLKYLYHCPNGGSRNRIEAVNLKRQGVKPGVPDLFLPYPNAGYHGLFIEMKVGKNKATENQKKWIKKLNENGYVAVICYGHEEAIEAIKGYLELERIIE